MAKKRTSLDSLFTPLDKVQTFETEKEVKKSKESTVSPKTDGKIQTPVEQKITATEKTKGEIVKQTVYLPSAVYEQLRQLAFEERKKMHDYLVEGLDRVFKDRGLKPYVELTDNTK